jgi:predicted Holliday junction resolvase-like endonuclease
MNNILSVFQSFRTILCVCPHCGEIMRLSDLHLKYSGKAPETWLDTYESEIVGLMKREEMFETQENELREKAIERGRKKVPELVEKCLCPEFKKLKYDPYDIKAIMHPVDFVVFDGLNGGQELKSVTFLSRKPSNNEQKTIIESIEKTVDKRDYEWKVARITFDAKIRYE